MPDATVHTGRFIRERLTEPEWRRRASCHRSRISELIDVYLDRRRRHQKDPVMDFLFEYYAFRPSRLRRWSPGLGVVLEGGGNGEPDIDELTPVPAAGGDAGGVSLDPGRFPENRKSAVDWIRGLLEQSAERKPAFGCFGMHEWAMVYRADTVRHDQLPLRMSEDELAAFVESRPLVCTHFDAFRFFTGKARPMNRYRLDREQFRQMEQPGCVHTNMDLYKWAFKMYPWISSDTIREAFELALEARYVDMKASPYDLSERGLEPIKIETEAGRMEYVERQRAIFEKSRPVRARLIGEYRDLREAIG